MDSEHTANHDAAHPPRPADPAQVRGLEALRRRGPGALAVLLMLTLAVACSNGEPSAEGDASNGEAAMETAAAPGTGTEEMAEPTAIQAEEPAPDADNVTDLEGRELLIGTDATYRPFEFVNEEGEIVGIDPDLMAAICEIANCTATFQNTAWDGIFAALGAGEFDAIMSAITILPEREEQSGATFTDPYFEVGQVVLARADSDLSAPSDIVGLTIGVQTGTTGDTAAVEELGVPEESVNRYETIVLAVEALRNGDVEAVVLDNPTADIFAGMHADLQIVGEPFTTEQYGILVPNTAPEVLSALNYAIGQLQTEGRIAEIARVWYAPEEGATE